MNRARALALNLVNWKGVFFERYLLDRHVTALEGANGAGKTTVMIAAYVVLLPDLQRLKFVNLGETGATGGDRGIWGRLGEQGPSYTALEIELGPGERVVCGVHLERKAAPSLSLTPFLISSLPEGVSCEQLLLNVAGAHEEVLRLDGLARNVKERGAALEIFGSGKDYFARLFELGIGPLRLSTDEERNKFNDMLRTSMTGGISRTLTSDLRSFLFKQESGLFDTLSRMRQNLDACRRTRLEVSESRNLEHEISGIHEAGHAMFRAVLGASHAGAAESRQKLERSEQARAHQAERVLELETHESEVLVRKASIAPRVERARSAESAARERLTRLARAVALSERLLAAQALRARAEPPAAQALECKARAQQLRDSSRADRDAAQATLLRCACGLASLQAGLEELHRQSHAFRRLRERLALARSLLAEYTEHAAPPGSAAIGAAAGMALELSEPLPESAPSHACVRDALLRVNEARRALDHARAERHRQAATSEQRQRDYAAARAALTLLTGALDLADPGARARQELARLNELDVLATRVDELEQQWHRLRALAERQAGLRAELAALGVDPQTSAREFALQLAALEQHVRQVEDRQRELERAALQHAERARATEARLGALRERAERYRRLTQVAERLTAWGQPPPHTASELGAQMRALEETRRGLHDSARRWEEERQQALALALTYEALGEGPEQGLVALAERLDGQLLTARYEELEIDEARRTQAELGPLNAAIVVEDPEQALALVCAEPQAPESVWLVRAGAWPTPEAPLPASEQPGHVVVDLGYGLRVTRLPEHVQLGRAARARRALELRSLAEAKDQELDSVGSDLREIDGARHDLEQIWEHWDAWSNGDPSAEIASASAELASASAELAETQRLAREARLEAARLRAHHESVVPHLGDHHLLDPPDYVSLADAARSALVRAQGAQAELARARDAQSTLLAQLHLLDQPAPAAAELLAWQRAEPALDAQRDRLFAAAEALTVLDAEHAGWAWSQAADALLDRTTLVPELEAQHERARLEVGRAQELFERAEAEWETATAQAQSATAELAAADAHLERARAELAAESAEDATSGGASSEQTSSNAVEQCRLELGRLGEVLERLRAEERGIDAEVALCGERVAEASRRLALAQAELERERALSEPAERRWAELSETAHTWGVLEEPSEARSGVPASGSSQLWLEAQAKRALLVDRLHAARGGADLAQSGAEGWEDSLPAESSQPEHSGSELPLRYLELWVSVRAWLSKRLPAPLGDLNDPLLGLARLETDLGQLERRLERQEGDLRGTSGDVARSIDVQVRRAAAQVRRLNASLAGVSFGSIHGIRVQMDRVTKMEQVLRALRDGETQELLFQSNLPIEAALDEIFRRHSGGRSGGQRLIDYREYLDLCVSIQRRPEAEWERVNPSQVSTGEAIGIGAALMMVILAEWERDDQLLRRQRTLGSLRFLFLDEANRLSQDNLGVLFDLCRTLDLQLLIAAPEVARAEGNTTYRLVRRVTDAGREEVLVTGRRSSLPLPPARPSTPEAVREPAGPAQAGLFTSV